MLQQLLADNICVTAVRCMREQVAAAAVNSWICTVLYTKASSSCCNHLAALDATQKA
jgi:hypothetical protein